jgi:hypothetical protein
LNNFFQQPALVVLESVDEVQRKSVTASKNVFFGKTPQSSAVGTSVFMETAVKNLTK